MPILLNRNCLKDANDGTPLLAVVSNIWGGYVNAGQITDIGQLPPRDGYDLIGAYFTPYTAQFRFDFSLSGYNVFVYSDGWTGYFQYSVLLVYKPKQ